MEVLGSMRLVIYNGKGESRVGNYDVGGGEFFLCQRVCGSDVLGELYAVGQQLQ